MKPPADNKDEKSWRQGIERVVLSWGGTGGKREREGEGRIEGGKNRGENEAFLATNTQ